MAVRKRRSGAKKQEDNDENGTADSKNAGKTSKGKTNVKPKKSEDTKPLPVILKSSIILSILISACVYYYGKYLWQHDNTKTETNVDKGINKEDYMNLTEWYLSNFICKANGGYCHKNLKAQSKYRTHIASDEIPKNETILLLPRKYIITDLDAMNDKFIQDNFFDSGKGIVKHHMTDNPLDGGAYLAVYLLSRRRKQQVNGTDSDDHMTPFFMMLPDDYQLYNHPVFWPKEDILSLLGNNTLISQTVIAFRDMMMSEFHAFALKSDRFKALFTLQNYMLMRVHVISRSFGTGPPDIKEATPEHLNYIKSKTGTSLEKGCRAMAPILDMWDHHAKPNANWHYDTEKAAFVVTSNGISQGHEIVVSYGRYTDTHLFAKFGFVNGDGSGWTEASIASLHRLPDIGLGEQFTYPNLNKNNELISYLQYDDGQPKCVEPTQEDEVTLKRHKYEHIKILSQVPKQWIMRMPPRHEEAIPTSSLHDLPNNTKLPNFNRNSRLDINYILTTCRLISINQTDYDTLHPTILSNHLQSTEKNPILHIPKQSDDAEFFALNCLERVTTKALSYYPSTVDKDMNYLKIHATNATFYKTRVWNAVHARLGEMQTLEVIRNVAISGMRQMLIRIEQRDGRGKEGVKVDLSRFKVRKKPCPLEWSTQVLLDDVKSGDKKEL